MNSESDYITHGVTVHSVETKIRVFESLRIRNVSPPIDIFYQCMFFSKNVDDVKEIFCYFLKQNICKVSDIYGLAFDIFGTKLFDLFLGFEIYPSHLDIFRILNCFQPLDVKIAAFNWFKTNYPIILDDHIFFLVAILYGGNVDCEKKFPFIKAILGLIDHNVKFWKRLLIEGEEDLILSENFVRLCINTVLTPHSSFNVDLDYEDAAILFDRTKHRFGGKLFNIFITNHWVELTRNKFEEQKMLKKLQLRLQRQLSISDARLYIQSQFCGKNKGKICIFYAKNQKHQECPKWPFCSFYHGSYQVKKSSSN